jgi:ATP-dependent Clp protease ATP-binding subunit ClpB
MRPDRFTQKMQEALSAAADITSKLHQQEIGNEQFLLALLDQSEGVAVPLLQKVGVSTARLREQLDAELARRPKVSGGAQPHLGSDLRQTLDAAEGVMEKLKDEYLSAEHYLLALSQGSDSAAKLLKADGATHDKLMKALVEVRGSQRVTDQNPEEKYQALQKYGRDLTESAAPCRSSRAAQKTTRSSSANPAWARPPSSKALPAASSAATCPNRSRTRKSSPWTSAR